MKCELKWMRYAMRIGLTVDSWKALMVRVVGLGLLVTIPIVASSIAYHYKVDHIINLYAGCMFLVMAYLIAWHECRKG